LPKSVKRSVKLLFEDNIEVLILFICDGNFESKIVVVVVVQALVNYFVIRNQVVCIASVIPRTIIIEQNLVLTL